MFVVWGRAGIKIISTVTLTGIIQGWIWIILGDISLSQSWHDSILLWSLVGDTERGRERGLGGKFPDLLRQRCFLVCFAFVNFQALHSFETSITLITLVTLVKLHMVSQAAGWIPNQLPQKKIVRLLCKNIFSPFAISFEGWWAFSLWDPCRQGCLALLGLQWEGEGGADGDGELEHLAMSHDLPVLGRRPVTSWSWRSHWVSHTYSSHFWCLYLNF